MNAKKKKAQVTVVQRTERPAGAIPETREKQRSQSKSSQQKNHMLNKKKSIHNSSPVSGASVNNLTTLPAQVCCGK